MMERFKNQNQNANETDYDKQFKEDMEKAAALSMESLALEEFHRNKSHHSTTTSTTVTDGISTTNVMKFSTCKYIPHTLVN